MKIDGIDSLALNRMREHQESRPAVRDPGRIEPDIRVKQREKVLGERPSPLAEETVLEQLETGIQRLNDTSEAFNLSLRFLLHEESERWMVQVVDLVDDKVIREIPPEYVLNVVAQIQDLIGVLLDERR
ncbi:MAG: flagellar protein FlaG [Firmicutes bacterium]|nr:flagellar protein FlaG [Bacillota bacterium]